MQITEITSVTPRRIAVRHETSTRSSVPVMGNDDCRTCGGVGDIECGSHQGNGCEYCGGTRRVVCPSCHGSGKK